MDVSSHSSSTLLTILKHLLPLCPDVPIWPRALEFVAPFLGRPTSCFLKWAELCLPTIHMLKSSPLKPQSATLCGSVLVLMVAHMAYGSSPARDWIRAAAVIYAAAAATLDPLTHCARLGSEPHLCSEPSHWSQILNPLFHGWNSKHFIFEYIFSISIHHQLLWSD